MKSFEAATGGVLKRKVFLETSQNLQENPFVGGLKPATVLKTSRDFPVNFAKFLRTRVLKNNSVGGISLNSQECTEGFFL